MAYSITILQKNAALNAIATAHNNGSIKIYAGSVPASADAALGGATLLVSVPLGATAFAAASAGSMSANAITQANATATGTASFYRAYQSDGTTVLGQGTVGTTGADLNLTTTSIVLNGPVNITSYQVSI